MCEYGEDGGSTILLSFLVLLWKSYKFNLDKEELSAATRVWSLIDAAAALLPLFMSDCLALGDVSFLIDLLTFVPPSFLL